MDAATHTHSTEAVPGIQKQVINTAGSGVDPMLLAMSGQGGMFGGNNCWLPLLFLLFGRGGFGGWGGGVNGQAGAFAAEAVAAQSIVTPKDTNAQLAAFQNWAASNAQALATQICGIDKSICCSSRDIIAAVNALTPQMYQSFATLTQGMTQGFASQAQQACATAAATNANITQTGNGLMMSIKDGFFAAEKSLDAGINGIEKSLDTGFSQAAIAQCQTQNLINTTSCDNKTTTVLQANELSKQLAACCCENRLAIANQNALIERNTAAIQNQVNLQTCEIKQAIAADGQATRALINQNTLDQVRAELADAKAQLSNCQQNQALRATTDAQTAAILAHLTPRHDGPCGAR